jgi:ribosomal 30S subunit maturation factor RimM
VKKEKKNDTEIVHDSDEKFLSFSESQNDDLLNLFRIVYNCSDIEKLMEVYDTIKDYLRTTYNGLVYFPFVNNDDISNEKNFQNNIIEIVNDENIPDEDFFYFKELIHSIILSNESNPP